MSVPSIAPAEGNEGRKLRIVSYNVHAFHTSRCGRLNVDHILKICQYLDVDVMMLQEATHDEGEFISADVRQRKRVPTKSECLEYLAMQSGLYYFAYHSGNWSGFGNAILSKYKLCNVQRCCLGRNRSAVCATIYLPFNNLPLGVMAIHLDHRIALKRMEQIEKALEFAKEYSNCMVIAGDFNSLTRADYTETEWQQVARMRESTNWEPPQEDVCAVMRRAGWKDSINVCPYADLALDEHIDIKQTERWREVPVKCLRRTCWAGTRIDYLYVLEPLVHRTVDPPYIAVPPSSSSSSLSYQPPSCSKSTSSSCEQQKGRWRLAAHYRGLTLASDHYPVICDFIYSES